MRDQAPTDHMTSRSRQIAAKVAVLNIKQKLKEIEEAVERKVEERRNGGNGHAE